MRTIQHPFWVIPSPLKTLCYFPSSFLLLFRIISLLLLFFWVSFALSAHATDATEISLPPPYYIEHALPALVKKGEPIKGGQTWYNEHVRGVYSSSFSAQGDLLAITSVGKPIELWNIGERKLATTFIGSTENKSAFVDLSADGNLIAFSMDGRVELRNIKQRSLLFSIPIIDSGLSTLSKNGRYLASAIDGKRIDLWDTKQQQRIHSFIGNQHAVTALKFSDDGRYLVSANKKGLIKVWDIGEKTFMYELDSHQMPVTSLRFSSDSKQFVTVDTAGKTLVWDIERAAQLQELPYSLPTPLLVNGKRDTKQLKAKTLTTAVAISPNNRLVMRALNGAKDDVVVDMFDILSGKRLFSLTTPLPVNNLAFLADNRLVAFSFANKVVKLFDSNGQRFIDTFGGQLLKAQQATVSPNGEVIAVGTMDGVIQLWDAQKKSLLYSLKGHQANIKRIAFSADAQFIVAGDDNGYVMLWDHSQRRMIGAFQAHKKGNTVFALSPDKQFLVTATTVSSVMTLWNVASQSPVYTFRGHHSGINGIHYTADGKTIVSASDDGSVKLWDVATRKVLHSFTSDSRNKKFTALALSRDGKYLAAGMNASGSDSHGIEVWSLEDLKHRYSFNQHTKKVTAVQFSPDGERLVSAAEDGTIKLWHLQQDVLVKSLQKQAAVGKVPSAIHSIAFANKGNEVVSVDGAGGVDGWNLEQGRLDYTMIGGPRGTWISENHVKKRFWRGDDGSLVAKIGQDASPKSVAPSGMAAKDTLVITASRKELEVPAEGGKVRITVKNRGRNPSFWIQVRQRNEKSTPVTLLPNKLTKLAAGQTQVMDVQFITHDLDFIKTRNRLKLKLELVTKAGSTFPINIAVKLVKHKSAPIDIDEQDLGRNK